MIIIYNKGIVYISGTASLSSASSNRATVQNDLATAQITISGGTIASTNTSCERGAVQNGLGTLTVTGGTIISKSNNTSNAAGIQNVAEKECMCVFGGHFLQLGAWSMN